MNSDTNLAQLLHDDIEDSFPSDGGGASFMMVNAPGVLISRDTKLDNRIVPVYFIACRKNGEDFSEQLVKDIFEGTGRVAMLRHRYEGKALGKCIVIPFLFHMMPSAKAFCSGIERYLAGLRPAVDVVWQLEYCHVFIMHNNMEYEPSESIISLRS